MNTRRLRRVTKRRIEHNPIASNRAPRTTGHHWLQDVTREHQARRAADRALRKIPTGSLGPIGELLAIRYPTLLDLRDADRTTLLRIPGVSPRKLDSLAAALGQRGLPVKWSVAAVVPSR